MKKYALISLLYISAITGFGQNHKFTLSISGGNNYSYLKNNNFDKNQDNAIFCFSSGFALSYNFAKLLSIETGFGIEQTGSITNYFSMYIDGLHLGEYRYLNHYNYLVFPILLNTSIGHKTKIFLNTGGFVSHLINAQEIRQMTYNPTSVNDVTSLTKRTNYGILVGIGFSLPIKNRIAFSAEVRNNIGMCNLVRYIPPYFSNEILKTNSINLLVGIKYQLKNKKNDTNYITSFINSNKN
jgi:hypothetical protein